MQETEKHLVDEMEAWEEMRKAELLALAEKLGCSIYSTSSGTRDR